MPVKAIAHVRDKGSQLANINDIVAECNRLIEKENVTFEKLFDNLDLHKRIVGNSLNKFYVFTLFTKI